MYQYRERSFGWNDPADKRKPVSRLMWRLMFRAKL